jgi:hypothetical protein
MRMIGSMSQVSSKAAVWDLPILAAAVSVGMLNCTGRSVRCADSCRYFGQQPPGCSAQIFAPGILSTDLHEDGAPIFTPDQEEVYFRVAEGDGFSVFFLEREGNAWSRVKRAPFSDEYNHGRIAISPDGRRIYFSSDRPAPDREDGRSDFDIWFVEREGDSWGEPVHLGQEVNTTFDELDMSVAADLTLFFNREGSGPGMDDILRSKYVNGRYEEAIRFEWPLNSDRVEAAPHISPDQSFLIFTSASRAGSRGDLDLYVSFRGSGDSWSEPRNLGDGVNTRFSEKFTSLSPDGQFLFFSSNRPRSATDLPGDSLVGLRNHFERTTFINRPKLRPHFVDLYWVSVDVVRDTLGLVCPDLVGRH